MPKTRNTLFVLGSWLVAALVVGVLLLWPLLVAVRTQNWGTVALIAVCTVCAAGWVWYLPRRASGTVARLLLQPSPAPLVQWFETSLKSLPDARCHIAFNTGLVYAYYGDFAQARVQLNAVAWNTKLPLLAGMGALLESLLDYLELHDPARGRERAVQARSSMDASRALPGSTLARTAQDAFVLVGTALAEPATHGTVTALETHFARLPLLVRLLVAWALASVYQQQNQPAKAAAMRAFLAEHAPHCRGLVLPTP